MLSFRVSDDEASALQRWADALRVDRSELLRSALHQHLLKLRSGEDALIWQRMPLTDAEQALLDSQDWGLAEDWLDWSDAKG